MQPDQNSPAPTRLGWVLGIFSLAILPLTFFVTSIIAPLGAVFGAYTLYIGMRLKSKALIIVGSIGLVNLVLYVILAVSAIIRG